MPSANLSTPPPYPELYVRQAILRDGTQVTLRPICPADEEMMIGFHAMLSEQSVRYRYFGWLKLGQRTAHERLEKICHVDLDRDVALVVEHAMHAGVMTPVLAGKTGGEGRVRATGALGAARHGQSGGDCEILAVGRLSKVAQTHSAEFALLVRDDQQSKGIGRLLLTTLIQIARDGGLTELTGDIMPENVEMQRLAERVGFRLVRDTEENIVRAVLELPRRA